jgi:ribonuclease P protein component
VFARKERLSRDSFPTALSLGRRISSPNFSVAIPLQGSGYAVVVSKKVAKLSVTRHTVKRRVVGVLRSLSPKHSAKQSV